MRRVGWLVVASLLAGCEGWQTYSEPTVVDVDGMGRVHSYEAGGGWRSEPVDDGKGAGDARSFEME